MTKILNTKHVWNFDYLNLVFVCDLKLVFCDFC